jgi:hypothetical protein
MQSTAKRLMGALVLAGVVALMPLGPSRAQVEFNQAKLESFVTAAIEVSKLVQQWSPRIQKAENQKQAKTMTEQANSEIEDAVEKSGGITVEEYKQIAQAARSDAKLTARIERIFKDRMGQQ